MRATLVQIHNPFAPMRHRAVRELHAPGTIAGLVAAHPLAPGVPFIVTHNGAPVLRADWARRQVLDGDVVACVALPQGGGGGGSSPLRIIAMLAVSYFAGPLAGAAGFTEGTASFLIAKAAIGITGSLLVNALLPAPKPPQPQRFAELSSPSPTYALQAQGNNARIGGAIPVAYGRNRLWPDYAAAPYTEYAGNEQYLYSLLMLGQGSFDIEETRIGESAISSFEEVTTEVVAPGAAVTLFPTNVVTSSDVTGQEATNGVALGPFVASAAGTEANYIAIDVICPAGLYYANDTGGLDSKTVTFDVEAREIDDSGTPVGGYSTLGSETITAATNTPQRRSYRYSVTAARYEVRLTRTNAKDTSSRAGHELDWAGLRAYLPGSQAYGQCTLLAVRMRATNQLSSTSSRKINVIATRKLATRSGGGWTAETATRSIAWALADACRDLTYGAALSEDNFDLAGLESLDSTWTARGDSFDFVFDNATTFWDALTIIARAGRAMPIQQGTRLYFVRDEPRTLPTSVYTMRNIVRGTMAIKYAMVTAETPDGIKAEYWDNEIFAPRSLTVGVQGLTPAAPADAKMAGMTARAHSGREALYMAAANRYRRKFISFQTELEGHAAFYGDLVAVQHDMPGWGQFADCLAWDAATRTLVVDQPLSWTAGATHYVLFNPRGAADAAGNALLASGPWAVTQGADERTLVLAETPEFTPYAGGDRERTTLAFGPSTNYRQLARVLSLRPRNGRVELELVNEDERVHSADGASVTAAPSWDLPQTPTIPEIASGTLKVVQGGTPASPFLAVSWQPAAGADFYLVEHSVDGVAYTRRAEPVLANAQFDVPAGAAYVRVAPVGGGRGTWRTWNGTVTGDTAAPVTLGAPSGLAATAGVANIILTWTSYTDAQAERIEVLRNTTNDSAGASVVATLRPATTAIWADNIGSTNVTRYYWIRAVNRNNVAGTLTASVNATTNRVNGGSDITAATITGDRIVAATITADKLSVTSLSAVSANLGTITAGTITLDTSGYVRGGQTDYATGTGFFLGYSGAAYKFSIGDSSTYLKWDGSSLSIKGSFIGTDYSAGTKVIINADGECTCNQTSYTKLKEVVVARSGTLTVDFDIKILSALTTAYARIYVNGSAVGTERTNSTTTYSTFSENISGLAPGDLIQIYGKTGNASYGMFLQNMKVKNNQYTQERVNTDITVV